MLRFLGPIVAVTLLATPMPAPAEDVPDALSVEWNGHKPCELLDEDAQIRVLKCTFEPGDKHLKHSHPANFSYVIAGSGGRGQTLDAKGTREFDIKEGAFFTTPPVPWHEFTNIGATTIVVLVVEKKYAPAAAASE